MCGRLKYSENMLNMENIRIFCENDRQYHLVPLASDLKSIAAEVGPEGTIAALVDNQLKELDFKYAHCTIHRI